MGAALVLLLVGLGAMAAGVLIGRYYVPDDRQLRRTARHSKAYMRALSHLVARDHDTVITELRNVVEENVEDAEPYFALGAIFRSRGEHERAIRVHQALALRERDKRKLRQRAMYELGLDFRAAGMPRRATRAMEEVVVQEPGHEGALRVLAALYEEQSRFNEAAGLWQRLGRRRGEDTSHREHHLLVAAAQTALGRDDLDSAKQLLKTAQKHEESAHFFAAAAELAAARGNHRGAKERLKQALIAEPGLAPHLLPGLIAAEQGLSGEAGDRSGSDELDDEVAAEAARLAADSRLALPEGTGDSRRRTPSQPLVAVSSLRIPESAGSAPPHDTSLVATSAGTRLADARPGRATQVGVAAAPATSTARAAPTAGPPSAVASAVGAPTTSAPTAGASTVGASTAVAPMAGAPMADAPTAGASAAGAATTGAATTGAATTGAATTGASAAGAATTGAANTGAANAGASTAVASAAGALTAGASSAGAPTAGASPGDAATADAATAGVPATDRPAVAEISQAVAASEAPTAGLRGTLLPAEAAAIASHGFEERAPLGAAPSLDDGGVAGAADRGAAEDGWRAAEESALVRSQRGSAAGASAASSAASSRSPTLHGVALVPAQRPSASVTDRVLAVLAEIEAQSGPRLELALIRAQLVPPQDTADRAALARELIARFPDALAARVASARLAIASGDPNAIRGALEALVSDGGALAWTLRGRWQCAHCGHRPGPFSWRCGQCRRWGTLRMETGVEPPPLPPRERRAAPRVARPDALLGASPDESLPAPTLDPGLSDAELANAGARRSLLGRVGGWVSSVWRRGA